MRSGLLIALVMTAACRDAKREGEPVVRHPDFRASYSGSLDPKFPHGRDLTISAAVELTDDKRRAIEAALGGALAKAFPCMEGLFGTAPTEIEIAGDGKVVKAVVTSELLGGTKIAECIETALRTMQLGAVEGAPIRIAYPVRNMPSEQQLREAAELVKGL